MDAASGIGDVRTGFDDNMDDAPAVVKAVVGIDTGTVVAMIATLAMSLRSALHIFNALPLNRTSQWIFYKHYSWRSMQAVFYSTAH